MDSEPDSGGGGVEIWLIREESGWLGGVRWDWLWRWVGILFRFLVGETMFLKHVDIGRQMNLRSLLSRPENLLVANGAYLIDLQPFRNTSSMVLMLTGQCSQLVAVLVSHTAYHTFIMFFLSREYPNFVS